MPPEDEIRSAEPAPSAGDVTPSSPAEMVAALRRTEAAFREFIDLCPDAVFVRRGPEMVHVNAALLGLLGYDREELLGRDPLDVFLHPDFREEARTHRVERPDMSDRREHRWLRKDGETVVVEVVGVTVTFEGAPARIVMCRDLTERRKLEGNLLVADRMASVGTLASGIAHEINNPLAYVLTNLELITEELRELGTAGAFGSHEAGLREMLADARTGAERVRRIVRGMKLFTRTDDEHRTLLDVRQVVDMAINLASNEIRHRARLVRDFGATGPVHADEGRLVQVFVNLLVNAAQSIPMGHADRHEIAVVTRTDDAGRVVISIRDSGVGMPLAVRARIFDPFFTTKPVGQGTGLGLSMAHNVVTALGGEITVESEVGAGTTFRVSLPTTGPGRSMSPAEGTATARVARREGRVLVIDDDAGVGAAVRRALKGFEVTVVSGGRAALTVLSQGEVFDCVLCDLMMPEMTGMELFDELSRTSPTLVDRIVFLTGGAFTPAALALLERVSNVRIDKPFSVDRLRTVVGSFVR